jgi:hypothetical protein
MYPVEVLSLQVSRSLLDSFADVRNAGTVSFLTRQPRIFVRMRKLVL